MKQSFMNVIRFINKNLIKRARLITFLFLISQFCYSQWNQLSVVGIDSLAGGHQIKKIDGKLFVTGDNYGVYMSADNGNTWVSANKGFPLTSARVITIYELTAIKDTLLYAAVNIDSSGIGIQRMVYYTSTRNINWKRLKNADVLLGLTTNPIIKITSFKDTLFIVTNQTGNNARYFKLALVKKDSAVITEIPRLTTNPPRMNARNCHSLVVDTNWVPYRLLIGIAENNCFAVYNPLTNSCTVKSGGIGTNVIAIYLMRDTIVVSNNGNGLFYALSDSLESDGFLFYKKQINVRGHNVKGIYQVGSELVVSTNNLGTAKVKFNATRDSLIWSSYGDAPNIDAGLYTSNGFVVDGSNMYIISKRGVFVSSDNGLSYTSKINGLVKSTNTINAVKSYNNKLYALTTSGIYVSNSGNGGDWIDYGLSGKSVGDLLIDNNVTLAIANNILHQYNGSTWKVVDYKTDTFSLNIYNQKINNLFRSKTGRIFVGTWPDANQIMGVYMSDDNGLTWTQYYDTAHFECPGVNCNIAGYNGFDLGSTGNRVIATNFTEAPSGKFFSTNKSSIGITDNNGSFWYYRYGNYLMNRATTTFRQALARTYKGNEYLFIGSEITSAGHWWIGRSLINDTVCKFWTQIQTPVTLEVRNIVEYGEDLLFIRQNSGGGGSNPDTRIFKSEDNGDSWTPFETNLPRFGSTLGSSSKLEVQDGILYFCQYQNIYTYDLKNAPAWNTGSPVITNISYFNADLIVNNSKTGRAYYVVLPALSPAPSIEQVIAGQDASGALATLKGNMAVTANTDSLFKISGLESNTAYICYVVVKGEVVKTTSLAAIPFTTLDDAPAWNFGMPKISNVNENSAILTVNSTLDGVAFYVVLLQSATAPSKWQVINGLDASNNSVPIRGWKFTTANVDSIFNIEGLSEGTTYSCYVVDTVAAVNKTTPLVRIDFTTANTTGLYDLFSKNKVNVYPNPVNDYLTISINDNYSGQITIKVMDMTGQEVMLYKFNKTTNIFTKLFDVKKLKEGIYYVQINTNKKMFVRFLKL